MLQELEEQQAVFKVYGVVKPELEIWQTNNINIDKDGIRTARIEEFTTKEIVDYVNRNVKKALDYLEAKEKANRDFLTIGDIASEDVKKALRG